MTLRELLTVLDGSGLRVTEAAGPGVAADGDVPVAALAYDSRTLTPGALFMALRGAQADGAAFAAQAAARGAIAAVGEGATPAELPIPWIRVSDGRLAMATLAAHFYGHPSRAMRVVGITGTNGKTTTAYLIREVFEAAGESCGLMGTVQYRIGAELREASRTTPEAVDLQQMFREMADAGCVACAMEVSSHALALRRADGTRFAACVFTNLTRDHLDFHLDMDQYFAAKRRLFELLPDGAPGVVNVDDPRGATLASQLPTRVTYAVDRPADVMPVAMPASLVGLSFDVRTPSGTLHIASRLAGRFNVYNLLAATATGVALGLPAAAIESGLAGVSAVPGRFQVVSSSADDLTVIVDYAHTDDALKNLLEAVRPIATARMITVFGCGGDRDRTKRPLMGAVAARLSDVVVITSDNPRSEDPERIIDEIERGIAPPPERPRPGAGPPAAPRPGRVWWRMADRRAAIERAVQDAHTGDVVVVAGKGHEKYQVIRERVLPFDDVDVACEALARRRTGGPA
ncbi:MAG: UDP-N-acetylmuramoyl-L-alanyl-D-glutamate--2,6-diaminopimelate ligase [Acidobacteria bacterium]|nr:UDP-N-acetylmuramoyl-L-alanyl-D-glutamate--2,6-diaminopimelate ligase [Acidobacteriota bacterium]